MPTDEKLLLARVEDAVRLCDVNSSPKFIGFLDETSAQLAFARAKNLGGRALLYGGAQDLQRTYLGVFPDWCERLEDFFPITPITARFPKAYSLSHRDFLGSLMGLKIKREAVGDILIEEGRAVIFLSDDIADFVLGELDKVGRVGVSLVKGIELPLPGSFELKDFSSTISSPRLDSVVSALINSGRSSAAELIENGFVSINAVVCEKVTKQVLSKDIIRIRGKGKFIIDSLSELTKKKRIILKYKKYV